MSCLLQFIILYYERSSSTDHFADKRSFEERFEDFSTAVENSVMSSLRESIASLRKEIETPEVKTEA